MSFCVFCGCSCFGISIGAIRARAVARNHIYSRNARFYGNKVEFFLNEAANRNAVTNNLHACNNVDDNIVPAFELMRQLQRDDMAAFVARFNLNISGLTIPLFLYLLKHPFSSFRLFCVCKNSPMRFHEEPFFPCVFFDYSLRNNARSGSDQHFIGNTGSIVPQSVFLLTLRVSICNLNETGRPFSRPALDFTQPHQPEK